MGYKQNGVKNFFGAGVEIMLAIVVIAFLGLKSLDFFTFTTPADQWFYAYLGFGLTGGGVIGYMIIFMFRSNTDLKKTIAITMLIVCIIGELVTAGFGLQVTVWEKKGYVMQESDFDAMVLAVQLLGFAHAIALVAFVAGDKIGEAFGDHDGDGVLNAFDKDYRKPAKAQQTPAVDFEKIELQRRLNEMEKRLASVTQNANAPVVPPSEIKPENPQPGQGK